MKTPCLALCLVCLPASAQQAAEMLPTDSTLAAEKSSNPAPLVSNHRTPGKAALISLGSMVTLIGTGGALLYIYDPTWGQPPTATENFMRGTGGTLIGAGIFAGPSAGQIYMRDYGHAAAATLLRASGLTLVLASSLCFCEEGDNTIGITLGLGLFFSGMIYSFAQPYLSHPQPPPAAAREARFEFFPTLTRIDGRLIPGLATRVAF